MLNHNAEIDFLLWIALLPFKRQIPIYNSGTLSSASGVYYYGYETELPHMVEIN
jgi:hypothetical protein